MPDAPSDRMSMFVDVARQQIAERGYALHSVKGEGSKFEWTYTIGFTGLGHPELCLYNLPETTVRAIVDRMLAAVMAGHTFHHGDMVDRIIPGFPLAMLAVPHGYPWLVASSIYDLFDIRGLLVISPDRQSRFPWDPGSDIADQRYPTNVPADDEWNTYDL